MAGAVSWKLQARQVGQSNDASKFPSYGEWQVYDRGILQGSGGLVAI